VTVNRLEQNYDGLAVLNRLEQVRWAGGSLQSLEDKYDGLAIVTNRLVKTTDRIEGMLLFEERLSNVEQQVQSMQFGWRC
jgi:hypothetical protein